MPKLERSEREFPAWAHVPGFGLCRVLSYEGGGNFRLLSPRDERLFRARSQFQFRNLKPITGGPR